MLNAHVPTFKADRSCAVRCHQLSNQVDENQDKEEEEEEEEELYMIGLNPALRLAWYVS